MNEKHVADSQGRKHGAGIFSFFDGFDDPVLLLDPGFHIQYANKACLQFLGYAAEGVCGMPFFNFIPASEKPVVTQTLTECLHSNTNGRVIYHGFLTAGGLITRCRTHAVPHQLADRTAGLMLHLGVDVPKNASEIAKTTAALYAAIAEQTNDCLYLHDYNGRILQINQQSCDTLGYTKEELLSMSVGDVDVDFELDRARDRWNNMRPGVRFTIRGRHRRKNGSVFPVVMSFGGVVINGEMQYIALARDITDVEQSEAMYKAIVEGAPDPIFIQTEHQFSYLNPAACALFGLDSQEELLGTPVLDRIPPEKREITTERIRRLYEECQPVTEILEQEFLRKDGSSVWAETKGEPIVYNGKKGALVFMRETTRQRETERALQRSEDKYATLFNEASLPVLLLTYPDLCIVEVNDAWVKLIGYSRDDVIGKTSDALGITRITPEVDEIFKKFDTEGGVVENVEVNLYAKSGAVLTVLVNAGLLELDDVQYVLISNQDITERKKTEKLLYDISEKFQKSFDYSAAGMSLTGLDGRLITVNRAMCELFGYTKEELEGKHFSEITYPEDIDESNDAVRKMLSGEIKSISFEKRYVRKNGEPFWVSATSAVLRDQEGRPEHFITQILDIMERRRAEERLREISERYQKSFDYSPIGMFLMKIDGLILDVNNKMCEIFRCEKAALEGQYIMDLTYAEDIKVTADAIGRILTGEANTLSYEKRYVRRDGDMFWSSVVVTVLMGQDGTPDHCIVQIQDITERRQMLEELRAREEFSRTIMDNLPIGISVNSFKPPLRFDYMNDNFAKFYRTTKEALSETDVFFDAVYEDPEFREEIRQRVVEDMMSGDPKRMHWENIPITRKGEETRYVSAFNTTVPGKDLHISIVTDETERVRQLATIRNNEARLKAIHAFDMAILSGFESFCSIGENAVSYIFKLIAPQMAGIGIFSQDGRSMHVVKGERGVAGVVSYDIELSDDEIMQLGRFHVERDTFFLGSKRPPAAINRIFSCRGACNCYNIPIHTGSGLVGILNIGCAAPTGLTDSDVETIWEMATQTALAIEQKRLITVTEDHATQLEEMVRERTYQLESAIKELEAFTYSVSHDLRAPLRSVSGFIGILCEDYGSLLDAEGKRICDIIGSSAQQMGRLIDDLLALSRVGRTAMCVRPVDMTAMITSLISEIVAQEQQSRVHVEVGPLPEAHADPTLIRQVWQNLLDNAVKFSSKKTQAQIKIWGREDGDEIIYAVADNGAGFDMKYQNKLFGVFQRLHSAKEFDGTGVGLAIVQRIVSRHGGTVWADGEIGTGATFYFSLRKETLKDESGNN